ncbi:MAG: hypothetical protein HG424_001115 [candidate division SR1 bacterium]|nr:hypothetical protein [candidate division SR1 bacterium]
MKSDRTLLIYGLLIGGLISYIFLTIRFYRKIKRIQQTTVRQSRSSILGEVSEKLSPLLPNFPYHTKDLVFVGKGIDYIVFDGLSSGRLREIIFLEIKTNTSQLNKNEQQIRFYLANFPVKYEVLKIKY